MHPSLAYGRALADDDALALLGAGDDSQCQATLPSSTAAERFLNGEPGGLVQVVAYTALRGALISAGAYTVGLRGDNVWKAGLGGALGIEAFVLGYVWLTRPSSR